LNFERYANGNAREVSGRHGSRVDLISLPMLHSLLKQWFDSSDPSVEETPYYSTSMR